MRKRNYLLFTKPSAGGKEKKVKIFMLYKSELRGYKKLGEGSGPLGMALWGGVKHVPNFSKRIVGYTVSKHGIGKVLSEGLGKVFPEMNEKQRGISLTYTFYERIKG